MKNGVNNRANNKVNNRVNNRRGDAPGWVGQAAGRGVKVHGCCCCCSPLYGWWSW